MTKDREIPLFSYCDYWLDGDRENRVNSEVIYSPIEKNIKVMLYGYDCGFHTLWLW